MRPDSKLDARSVNLVRSKPINRDFHFAFPAAREYASERPARHLLHISSKARAGVCPAGPFRDPKAVICTISEPTVRIAAILDAHSLLCRSCGGTAHYAATKTVVITETTSGCVLSLLPEGSRGAPTQSPVRGHAQMAKRQEAEQLDRFDHRFWIPLCRSVCQHAAPRFGSCRIINHDALELRPNRGTY